MDRYDLAIVEALKEDARASNAQIARSVGVSEGTVRRRLRRLMDDKLVEVRVIANPGRVGEPSHCFVGVSVKPDRLDEALAAVCELEEVTLAASSTGSYDMVVCVSVGDSRQLGEFLLRRLGAVPGVLRTETHVLLNVGKDSLGQFGG